MKYTNLPIKPECCLQGDDHLLLCHTQDVPQVDGGLNVYWLAFFCWRSLMYAVVLTEYYMVLCHSTVDQDGEEDDVRHPHHHHTHHTRLDTAVL